MRKILAGVIGVMAFVELAWAVALVPEKRYPEGFSIPQFRSRSAVLQQEIELRNSKFQTCLPRHRQVKPGTDVEPDLNGDGMVDIGDLVLVAKEYGKKQSNLKWRQNRNVNSYRVIGKQNLQRIGERLFTPFVVAGHIQDLGVRMPDRIQTESVSFELINWDIQNIQNKEDLKADMRFTNVTDVAGVGSKRVSTDVALGDYDNDGDLDIYVVNNNGRNVLYNNNGNGTFSDMAKEAGVDDRGDGTGACFGDYDNDGDLDLFVTNNGQNALYQNDGSGRFKNVTLVMGLGDSQAASAAAFGDYDNDGDLDIYVVHFGGENLLLRNDGRGGFTNVAKEVGVNHKGDGLGVAFGDYDNDRDLDIYLTNWDEPNVLYQNEGNGRFVEVTKKAGVGDSGPATASVFGDYDNDGDLDIYTVNGMTLPSGVPKKMPNLLYRNNGDGTFTEVGEKAGVADWGRGEAAAFADFDNDGDLDIYVANWSGQNRLYSNNGDGTFSEVSKEAGAADRGSSLDVAASDLDNNGSSDIYLANGFLQSGENRLYQNEVNENNWLSFVLVGSESNRDGVGAKITVYGNGVEQFREIGSGSNSGNSLRVEFGLGEFTKVEKVEVLWPSGRKQVLTDVVVNQVLVLKEEEAPLAVEENDQQETTWGDIKGRR